MVVGYLSSVMLSTHRDGEPRWEQGTPVGQSQKTFVSTERSEAADGDLAAAPICSGVVGFGADGQESLSCFGAKRCFN